MTELGALLELLTEIMPLVQDLLHLFNKTPEEKRAELITTLHVAFQTAQSTGDTSLIEKAIRDGK